METGIVLAFAVYFVGMLAIGVAGWRLTASLSDYLLGGRRLGPVVAALSAGASDMSGWLLLGLPGAVYASGISQMWIAVGLTAGAWLNWRWVARPLRVETAALGDSLTIPDFLSNRFGGDTRLLRTASALVILLFFTFYVSAGLVAGARLFEETFGFDYGTALGIGLLVIVAYTFLGGFLAVAWTDVVQGLLMLAALLVVPAVTIASRGGWTEVREAVAAVDPGLADPWSGVTPLAFVSLLSWGLGYFGQPHIVVRFMALRSPEDAPAARRVNLGWMMLSVLGAGLVGYTGIALFSSMPLENPESVFLAACRLLFTPWLAGLLLAAILAAVMSTIDSQLLVCSSAVTEDLYRAFGRRDASERELVAVGRGSVAAIALVAAFLALDSESGVLELVSYAWAGFGAALGPVILLSLYWRRMTGAGALAGLVMGAVTVVVWKQLSGGIFELYEILPGFLASGAAVVVVSRLRRDRGPVG